MTEIATEPETLSAAEPMPPAPDSPRALVARARAAAKAFARGEEPIGWTEALAAAPWPKRAPAAFETDFRRAFAEALVKRGVAKAALQNHSPRVENRTWRERETKLKRRLLSATEAEFAEQDKRAAAAGLSWSTWARRKLALGD